MYKKVQLNTLQQCRLTSWLTFLISSENNMRVFIISLTDTWLYGQLKMTSGMNIVSQREIVTLGSWNSLAQFSGDDSQHLTVIVLCVAYDNDKPFLHEGPSIHWYD